MEMSDCSWQHQKYARPEMYVVTYVICCKQLHVTIVEKKVEIVLGQQQNKHLASLWQCKYYAWFCNTTPHHHTIYFKFLNYFFYLLKLAQLRILKNFQLVK